jgi:flavin-binding protein dodecin
MSNHVYKVIELYGSSPKGLQPAIENAVAQAGKTVRNMRWVQVGEIRAHLDGKKIDHWQVGVKVGFTIED